MKILYILSGSVMGGATHSVLTLIKDMKDKGNQVIVVSPNMSGYLKESLIEHNIQWYVVRYGFMAYPNWGFIFIKGIFRLARILIREYIAVKKISEIINIEGIDIVHTNVGPVVCGYEACKKTRTPHVWHIREYGDKDFNIQMFPTKSAFRRKLQNSNVISITKDLLSYFDIALSSKACVIYNGVRRKGDVRLDFPKEKYFLCASRISPEKGFEQVIRVFASFHQTYPDYRLIILGSGNNNYINRLHQMATDLEVEAAISYEGYKDNVSEYMAKAKALLVASPAEGFGRMTAEAAFAGCLVIGKKTAGTKEIMDIIGGYPFITDDEMLQAMVEVANLSNERYLEKAQMAQQSAISHFSEEQYVESVSELYNSILSVNH